MNLTLTDRENRGEVEEVKVHASTIRERLYIGDSTQVKGKVHVDETRDTECGLQINGKQFITDGLKTCNCIALTFFIL